MEPKYSEIITRENIIRILKMVSFRMKKLKEGIIDEYGVFLSNKNLSEIIGKITEKVAADFFTEELGYEVKNAKADRDSDLVFTKIDDWPLEIKMTSTTNSWTGGEFSKRPFHYLLISWNPEDYDKYFVCFCKLKKEDWKSNFKNNYYGPSLSKKKLLELQDKKILLGELVEKGKTIKLIREKISESRN